MRIVKEIPESNSNNAWLRDAEKKLCRRGREASLRKDWKQELIVRIEDVGNPGIASVYSSNSNNEDELDWLEKQFNEMGFTRCGPNAGRNKNSISYLVTEALKTKPTVLTFYDDKVHAVVKDIDKQYVEKILHEYCSKYEVLGGLEDITRDVRVDSDAIEIVQGASLARLSKKIM
jgi:hypothetical protein